jgi:hypothetical protein
MMPCLSFSYSNTRGVTREAGPGPGAGGTPARPGRHGRGRGARRAGPRRRAAGRASRWACHGRAMAETRGRGEPGPVGRGRRERARASAFTASHTGRGAVATMAAHRDHGDGRRGGTKPREEGARGEGEGGPGLTVGGVGRARMGQGRSREVGRRGIVRAGVREGRGRGRFWGRLAGGPHTAGQRRLQPPAQGAARA